MFRKEYIPCVMKFPMKFPLKFEKYNPYDNVHNEFARYLMFGGFLATSLQKYEMDEVYTIVRNIYNSTIFTDIVKRSQIRKIDQLQRIVKFAFDNIGRTFSVVSISKYLKSERRTIDNEMVYSYLTS